MDSDTSNVAISTYPGNIYIIHDFIIDTFCENMRILIDQQATDISQYSNSNSVKAYNTVLDQVDIDYNILIKQDISLLLSGYVRAIANIISKVNGEIFKKSIPTVSTVELRKIFDETIIHIDNINRDNPRLLSCIIMLNDDYDDGIFSFPEQNVQFKPKKGDVILFPPYWTHPHKVSSPTNGFRYSITFWYNHHTSINNISIS
jgi:hypothetical protein